MTIVVVSGLPGAGKSSTAAALARRLAPAAHIEADVLHTMLGDARVFPADGARPSAGGEAARQLRLRLRQACLLARDHAAAGHTAVVDDIVIAERLDEVRSHLTGFDVHFVMLDAPFEAVRARWIAMGSPFVDAWDWIEADRQATERVGLWLDPGDRSVDEVADEIVRRLGEARLPA